jgi:O-antigen/teichoic acid export membrane protein
MPVEQTPRGAALDWLRRSRQWIRGGIFAVADQGLTSGSNFALSVLLARWLAPEQYGAYAVALSIFFFVSTVHQALLLEPMSVLATSEYSGRRREYAGAMLWFHVGFSIFVLAVFGAGAWLAASAGDRNLSSALAGLALGAPGILFCWLARMACYIELAPAMAACGALLYSVILLGGAWMFVRAGTMSAASVFVLMGGSAALAGAVLLAKIRPTLRITSALIRDAASRHWKYGRWALGSSLVIWVPGNIFYSITTVFLGIGSAGAFRALMNLTFPVTHTASALSMLFQPQLSRTAATSGSASTIAPVVRMTALYASGALAWMALVTFQNGRVWELLYGARFHGTSALAFWILVGVVFQVAAYGPAVGLRALQAPWLLFAAYSMAAAVCLVGGVPATRAWGLAGAVGSYSGALLLAFLATAVLYRRRARNAGYERRSRVAYGPALVSEAR